VCMCACAPSSASVSASVSASASESVSAYAYAYACVCVCVNTYASVSAPAWNVCLHTFQVKGKDKPKHTREQHQFVKSDKRDTQVEDGGESEK